MYGPVNGRNTTKQNLHSSLSNVRKGPVKVLETYLDGNEAVRAVRCPTAAFTKPEVMRGPPAIYFVPSFKKPLISRIVVVC